MTTDNLAFSQLCTSFTRANKLAGNSPHTIARHQQAQKLFLRFLKQNWSAVGRSNYTNVEGEFDPKVFDISVSDFEDFILRLQERNHKVSTINTYIRSLKTLWHWAHEVVEPPLLTHNPFRKVKQLKQAEEAPEFFTPSEFLRLLEAVNEERTSLLRKRNLAILLTLYDTGLRAEELCGLQVSDYLDNTAGSNWRADYDLDDVCWQPAGVLKVSSQSAKGGKGRQVPLSPATVEAINEWRAELEGKPHGRNQSYQVTSGNTLVSSTPYSSSPDNEDVVTTTVSKKKPCSKVVVKMNTQGEKEVSLESGQKAVSEVDTNPTAGRPGTRKTHSPTSIAIPWLFCSYSFGPLTRDALRLLCGKLGERVGLHCYPHKLRHSFAMFYINSSPGEETSLQKILSHSSPRMTKHYARLLGKATAQAHSKNSPIANLLDRGEKSKKRALNTLIF